MLYIYSGDCPGASQITSCNVRQRNDKKNDIPIDPVSEARAKELANKYNERKGVFKIHCNTCHIAPDKHASDQQLLENLSVRQARVLDIKACEYMRKQKNRLNSAL